MNMATGFDRRHPRGVILIRVLVTAWLLASNGILLANGLLGLSAGDARRWGGGHRVGLSRPPDDNAVVLTVGGVMIRVLVAEDMRILRDTLVSVLNLEDDIKVVAQVAAGHRHRARGAGGASRPRGARHRPARA
jgi:hypothetical protein